MKKTMICTKCGTAGPPQKTTKGSFLIEVLLWLCFLLPGLLYSLWRLNTRKATCSGCGSGNLVPVDSPVGKKLVREFTTAV